MKTRQLFTRFIFPVLTIVLLSISCSKPSQQSSSADHKAIANVLEKQLEQWNAGKIDGFMEGYWNSDSLLFMTKNGPSFGWETVRQNYHKSFPNREKMGKLTFDLERFHTLNDGSYLVVGRWIVDQGSGEKSGYFTLIFKNLEGSWKIIADHTFSD